MKLRFTLLVIPLMLIASACEPLTVQTQPIQGPGPIGATVEPVGMPSSVPTEVGSSGQTIPPVDGITLADNGRTFVMNVGSIFLLNLGMDVYDWTVEVDNQSVLSREKNVMVIRGAQGIYQALAPGQAVLTATGDPLCRQSTPACAMPSMIFKVTIIVQ